MCRLRIDHVAAALRGVLDERAIRAAAAPLLHLDLRIDWDDRRVGVQGDWEIGALEDEFRSYLAGQPLEGLDREAVRREAVALLEGTA